MSQSITEARLKYLELKYALRDGSQVSTCLYNVIGPFYYITNMWASWEDLDDKEQDLVRKAWHLVLRWFTYPKSGEEIDTFLSLTCTCSAQTIDGSWVHHEEAKELAASSELYRIFKLELGDNFLGWFVLTEFSRIYHEASNRCQLTNPHPHHVRKLSQRDSWPRSIKDLLPHGREDTLRGILQWFCYNPSTLMSSCLVLVYVTLLHFGSPVILPHLVTSRDFFLYVVIKPLERTWINAGAVNARGIWITDWNAQALACRQVLDLMLNMSQLLSAIISRDGQGAAISALYSHAPQAFFDCIILASKSCHSIMTACYMNQHPRLTSRELEAISDQGARVFRGWALRVLMDHGSDIVLDRSDKHQLEVRAEATGRKKGFGYDPWMQYVELMYYLTNYESQTCSAIMCSNSIMESRLRQCTGCRRVQYCSRSCQKRAWTEPTAPHRLLCSVMASLSRDYEIPNIWPSDQDEADRTKPSNLIYFPPRARLVLRNMKWYAQARLVSLMTGADLNNGVLLPHSDYNRMGPPPQWTKVDPKHYEIIEW